MSTGSIRAEVYAVARKAYLEGENIMQFLKNYLGIETNSPEIVEIAYHLQCGSYIEFHKDHCMDTLGYVNGISDTVYELGGRIVESYPLKTFFNPLNPTFCYVIEPPRQPTLGRSYVG
jgi:hypothetical protein